MGQPCYEEKIQELNTDFAKICNTPKPPGAPMGKVVPLVVPRTRKEAPTENAPMGATPHKAVTIHFPQEGETELQRLQGLFSTP